MQYDRVLGAVVFKSKAPKSEGEKATKNRARSEAQTKIGVAPIKDEV